MDNYIGLKDAIRKMFALCCDTDYPFIDDIQNALEEIPAADVRPIVRARWIMHSDRPDTLICTACDHAFDVWVWDHRWMHFCPNCGADMRETQMLKDAIQYADTDTMMPAT